MFCEVHLQVIVAETIPKLQLCMDKQNEGQLPISHPMLIGLLLQVGYSNTYHNETKATICFVFQQKAEVQYLSTERERTRVRHFTASKLFLDCQHSSFFSLCVEYKCIPV